MYSYIDFWIINGRHKDCIVSLLYWNVLLKCFNYVTIKIICYDSVHKKCTLWINSFKHYIRTWNCSIVCLVYVSFLNQPIVLIYVDKFLKIKSAFMLHGHLLWCFIISYGILCCLFSVWFNRTLILNASKLAMVHRNTCIGVSKSLYWCYKTLVLMFRNTCMMMLNTDNYVVLHHIYTYKSVSVHW